MLPATRLVVDGRALTDSSSYRGIGTYLRNVLDGLAGQEGFDVTVLCQKGATLPPEARRLTAHRMLPGHWQNREHEALLPFDLLRSSADLVWEPALDAPAFVRSPWVATLHDAWPVGQQYAPTGGAWLRYAKRLRQADAVIAVSRWSAAVSVGSLGLDPRRVHVIPHGVGSAFVPGAGEQDVPYLLFVGEYDPRKRHDHAFAAIGSLAERGFPHVLRVGGRIAPWFAQKMEQLKREAPSPERVELLGHVSLERLVSLYQGAAALVVTSEMEGFGLPALEAMACATPVVAYDNSATSEVVADAGVLVPDGDVEALTEALVRVLSEPGWAAELAARASERAAGFSWQRAVAEHAAVFREVACA